MGEAATSCAGDAAMRVCSVRVAFRLAGVISVEKADRPPRRRTRTRMAHMAYHEKCLQSMTDACVQCVGGCRYARYALAFFYDSYADPPGLAWRV